MPIAARHASIRARRSSAQGGTAGGGNLGPQAGNLDDAADEEVRDHLRRRGAGAPAQVGRQAPAHRPDHFAVGVGVLLGSRARVEVAVERRVLRVRSLTEIRSTRPRQFGQGALDKAGQELDDLFK
jgi:hypothetical protein